MYRPVTLETWANGPVRATIAAMHTDRWHTAILDHHADQVRADLSASGAQANRATLTLYLHVLSQAVDYVTSDVPDDALRLLAVYDTHLDWFTIRIAAVSKSLSTKGSSPDRLPPVIARRCARRAVATGCGTVNVRCNS